MKSTTQNLYMSIPLTFYWSEHSHIATYSCKEAEKCSLLSGQPCPIPKTRGSILTTKGRLHIQDDSHFCQSLKGRKVLETETRIWPGTKNISATPSPFSASLGCLIHCPLLSQLQLLHAQGCEHYGHLTISRLLHPVKENKTSQAPTQMKLGMSIHCQVKWIYDLTLGPVRGK